MTILEIFLTSFIWIVVGVWISYKRDWYKSYNNLDSSDRIGAVFCNIALMPIMLFVTIFLQYIKADWEND